MQATTSWASTRLSEVSLEQELSLSMGRCGHTGFNIIIINIRIIILNICIMMLMLIMMMDSECLGGAASGASPMPIPQSPEKTMDGAEVQAFGSSFLFKEILVRAELFVLFY